jgi:uncharacterized membrane protein
VRSREGSNVERVQLDVGAQQLSIIATIVALVVIAAYIVTVYLVWGTVKDAPTAAPRTAT